MVCRKIVIISGQEREFEGVKGILTLTTETEGVTAKISLYHISANLNDYRVVISCGSQKETRDFTAKNLLDEVFVSNLTLSPTDKINVLVGLSETGKPVAYGSNSGLPMWQSGLVALLIRERGKNDDTEPPAASPQGVFVSQEPPRVKEVGVPQAADAVQGERAVASKPRLADLKITPKYKSEYEEVSARVRQTYDDERIADVNFYPKSYLGQAQPQTVAHAEAAAVSLDAWGGYSAVLRPRMKAREEERVAAEKEVVPKYYLSVKAGLDAMFRSGKAEETLDSALKGTRWVRVPYRNSQHYCVGLIGSMPDYIGYAVPGTFQLNPPRQLEGLSKWLPLSSENPDGDGYWLMFQDACTGASVRLD